MAEARYTVKLPKTSRGILEYRAGVKLSKSVLSRSLPVTYWILQLHRPRAMGQTCDIEGRREALIASVRLRRSSRGIAHKGQYRILIQLYAGVGLGCTCTLQLGERGISTSMTANRTSHSAASELSCSS